MDKIYLPLGLVGYKITKKRKINTKIKKTYKNNSNSHHNKSQYNKMRRKFRKKTFKKI